MSPNSRTRRADVSPSVIVPSQSSTSSHSVERPCAVRGCRSRHTSTVRRALAAAGSSARTPAPAMLSPGKPAGLAQSKRRELGRAADPFEAGRRVGRTRPGVTTTGPRPRAKSRSFGGSGSAHAIPRASVYAADRTLRADDRCRSRDTERLAPGRDERRLGRRLLPDWRTRTTSARRTHGSTEGEAQGQGARPRSSGYSACSRAVPPPVKNDCRVCAASWTTLSPSTRPTQPRSSGCPTGWNMQRRIRARCVPRRPRSQGRHCARAPRSRSRDRARRRPIPRFRAPA